MFHLRRRRPAQDRPAAKDVGWALWLIHAARDGTGLIATPIRSALLLPRAAKRRASGPLARLRPHLGWVLTSVLALVGWALITHTVASVLTLWAWPVSGGLLLLSFAGFRTLFRVALFGLYGLTLDEEEEDET